MTAPRTTSEPDPCRDRPEGAALTDLKRVLVVDEHPAVRLGVAELLAQQDELELCGEAANAEDALDALERHHPDLVVLDVALEGGAGVGLIRHIHEEFPGIAVLVLTMHDATFHAEMALRAGARGFLTKQEANERFLVAVRQILSGQLYVSDRISPRLIERLLNVPPLDDEASH